MGFDQETAPEAKDGDRQRIAEPGGIPPLDAALDQERAQGADADYEESDAGNIERFERLLTLARGKPQQVHKPETEKRQGKLELKDMIHVVIHQQHRRQRPRQRKRDLGKAKRNHQSPNPHCRRQALHEVVDRQRRQSCGRNPGDGAGHQFGVIARANHLHEIGSHKPCHRPAHEGLDTEMLPHPEKQHAQARIGRIECDREPARLHRCKGEFGLDGAGIRQQEAVLTATEQPDENTDGKIGCTPGTRVVRIGGRPGQNRHLVRLETIAGRVVEKRLAISHSAILCQSECLRAPPRTPGRPQHYRPAWRAVRAGRPYSPLHR